MDLVLTIIIGLLIFYLFCKKIFKNKVSKKEEYTDLVQTVINEMKKKNSMDTLGEYFYVTLSLAYRNNERVKQAYADQEAKILYGETLDKIKSFTSLYDLNLWWNTQPSNLRKIAYIVKYKRMITDGLRFAFILSDESNKDKLNLLFENSPLNKNPVVIRAYNKKRKELYTPLVDAAMARLKTGNNGNQNLDYFNQITEDLLDFSETDDYKTSWDKISLKQFYTNKLGSKLSNFVSGGKPNESGLNTSDKPMAYYTWLSELDNYWLRLPEWVREYKKEETDSMLKVFQFNWDMTFNKVRELYIAELGLKYKLADLSEFHNKVPQRVKMFSRYQKNYKAIFNIVYKRAKTEMLDQIEGSKNRNVLVDFRKRSEGDTNYQGFFGIGSNIHSHTPSILTKFWERYDALTISEKQEALDNIQNTVENAKDGVSVFFELLRLWEDLEKIPTKKDSEGNDVPDQNYAHHNWISRLHKDTGRFSTSFSDASSDTQSRSDNPKDPTIHNVYIDYLNQYKDVEYNSFSDSLDITVGIGEVAGLSNITCIFNDSYFRDFIFKNQGVYNTIYNKIVEKWNEVFTEFSVKCFPDSDQVVQYVWYKTRWEAILNNKYYYLIKDENVQKIENAYTSNDLIKEQVIHEIGSIISVIVLEAFINMLPEKFKNDLEIQAAYESRVVQSLEADMTSYASMVALLEYWLGIKPLFRNLQAVKDLFHSVAITLMEKDIYGEKINPSEMGWDRSNIESGTGVYTVNDLMLYWISITDYKVIQNNQGYEEIIKTHLNYLFPQEVGRIHRVSILTEYWFGCHKFIRKRYKQLTWNTFFIRLEELYKRDMSGFKYPGQYENLVEYWRALDPIVRGQKFAWQTFFPIFEELVKNEIKTLKTTDQLEKRIWKHQDLLKYSSVLVEAYGKKINNLRIDEGMAKNVATLTKRGECPADFPYAFSLNDRYLPDSCCNHDPYINHDVGNVSCTNRLDCPYDAGCYMHSNLHCKSNSDCMAFNESLGEELKQGVKCDLLNGSCLYCPDGRQSPIGSPKCQWGAKNDNFKHPVPTQFNTIIP